MFTCMFSCRFTLRKPGPQAACLSVCLLACLFVGLVLGLFVGPCGSWYAGTVGTTTPGHVALVECGATTEEAQGRTAAGLACGNGRPGRGLLREAPFVTILGLLGTRHLISTSSTSTSTSTILADRRLRDRRGWLWRLVLLLPCIGHDGPDYNVLHDLWRWELRWRPLHILKDRRLWMGVEE